tara:strand:+ start:696 stop:1772 length:1077 start_codon:yes stop_codon:yes gene_type:complete
MKVCIIGSALTSLSLAKILTNMGINVDIFSSFNFKKIDESRTLSISKNNIDFFNSNITSLNKLSWKINNIEIYSDNLKNERVLNFENNKDELFSIIQNYQLLNKLKKELNGNRFLKFIKEAKIDPKEIAKNYDLIINCNANNLISKKFFYKKIYKKYNSFAYTAIIDHIKLENNKTAIQIFTKNGPLAFLPISDHKTSIVYSVRNLKEINFKKLIKRYNTKYSIIKFNKISKFELVSSNLRSYHHKNILAFGDMLHRLHPLAGQGFNMTIRDIKLLTELIKLRLENGLQIDSSICSDFEQKMRHKNFLFSNGIDFIYEFFNLESKFKNPMFSKTVQILGKNKNINKFFIQFADNGLGL